VSAKAQAAGRGEPPPPEAGPWLTPGVRGIGLASLLSDLGHEIPTALLPSFLSSVLGARAAALGLIEGVADALSGIAKLAGGALADDPGRRQGIAVGGYATTAVLSAGIGLATSALTIGLLRAGAWTARGLRVPARNALLADAVDPSAFGRAYGFERAMDNAGAVIGPLVALGLIAVIGIREAILVSVLPGLLAAVAILYAVRHLARPTVRHTAQIRIVVRPLRGGRLDGARGAARLGVRPAGADPVRRRLRGVRLGCFALDAGQPDRGLYLRRGSDGCRAGRAPRRAPRRSLTPTTPDHDRLAIALRASRTSAALCAASGAG